MANYKELTTKLSQQIEKEKANGSFNKVAFENANAVRRVSKSHDNATVIRGPFVRDVDKIINCPFYNRYVDKTQVLSFYKNDDISHRSLHVQLVSRIARTIGSALNLNVDLIEAIALGHDLGHTPFGHSGEHILDELYREKTGRRFAHNIHSVRVVDKIFPLNITLQTLDGIACHNGEMELSKYEPASSISFESFDKDIEKCYTDIDYIKKLVPSTLEGCVMRISDIIAYLGKDRHDAQKSKANIKPFVDYGIGTTNAEIVNNLTVNIVENSYGKNYIKMDDDVFAALALCKKENYDNIYKNPKVKEGEEITKQMMALVYNKLLHDIRNGIKTSPVFDHHIDYLNKPYYNRATPYEETERNQIVVDFIASMTDDYFIELFHYLFPKSNLKIQYKGYFE